jgi:hypothetical protein
MTSSFRWRGSDGELHVNEQINQFKEPWGYFRLCNDDHDWKSTGDFGILLSSASASSQSPNAPCKLFPQLSATNYINTSREVNTLPPSFTKGLADTSTHGYLNVLPLLPDTEIWKCLSPSNPANYIFVLSQSSLCGLTVISHERENISLFKIYRECSVCIWKTIFRYSSFFKLR